MPVPLKTVLASMSPEQRARVDADAKRMIKQEQNRKLKKLKAEVAFHEAAIKEIKREISALQKSN